MSNSVYDMPDEEAEKYSILQKDDEDNIRHKISNCCYWALVISISSVIIGSTLWCIIKYYA
jgi:hypothetical protein